MQRQALFATLLLFAPAGCEVSVFGSEPVSVFGAQPASTGGNEGRCGEPEELRLARVQLRDMRAAASAGETTSDAESPCAYTCILERGELASSEGCPLLSRAEDGSFTIDMGRADALLLRGEFCGTSILQLGDSARAHTDGSDDASSAHDASLWIADGELRLAPAHGSSLQSSRVTGFATSCTTHTIEMMDSVVYLAEMERGLCGTSMLRIDPPTDAQGSPDSRWHLSLGRALTEAASEADGAHIPERLELCFL